MEILRSISSWLGLEAVALGSAGVGAPRASLVLVWRGSGRDATGDPGEWEAALRSLYEAGKRAWPDLDFSAAAFVAHLSRAVVPGLATPSALAVLSGEGLFITGACAAGVAGAPGAFEAALFPGVRRAVGRLDRGATLADEVEQQLRVSFFVSSQADSLACSYSGTGALSSWLKVVALRQAQRIQKSHRPAATRSDEGLADLPSPGADPELGFLREHYRKDFKSAFDEALATLGDRQRNVLRLSLLEGLSIDEVGRVYAVHRATAARWVSAAREQLVAETRSRMAKRLKLGTAELTSLMGLVRSNLSISLSRGLGQGR